MNNRRFVDIIARSAKEYPETTFSRKGSAYTCVNPFYYHVFRKNNKLYDGLDGLFVDGILMAKLIGMLWGHSIPRLSFDMSGMAADLFERLNDNGESIYFIGSKQEPLEASISHIRESYPNMKIAGFRNGFFSSPEEREKVIKDIVALNPDFCIIGMGAPLQEKFAVDLKNAGFKGIAFTCGGFLHQTSQGINYYPDWVDKYNLRAFYRLSHEKGLWKRLYNVLIEFPFLFTFDTIHTRLFSGRSN